MVQVMSRRAVLGGVTLASAVAGRNSAAQVILTPKEEPAVKLLEVAALVRTDPPVVPSAQGFADAEGKAVTLAAFLGKGVVVNLWATWCVPCVAEMPALDALAELVAGEGVVVVPISSDRGGVKVVQSFYARHEVRHLGVWTDPKGIASRGWGARGLPTTLLIDREGRETGRLEGAVNWVAPEVVAMVRKMVGA